METKRKVGHGGKRAGSGRPRTNTVKMTWKIDPQVVERIKQIAQEQDRTESSVVNEFLYEATLTRQEKIEAAHVSYHFGQIANI
jgi:hypothetical protein